MGADERRKRLAALAKIPAYALHDHRNLPVADGRPQWMTGTTRNQRRQIEKEAHKLSKKYNALIHAEMKTGAGFEVDNFLREQIVEFNHRYASAGPLSQPLRFDHFEPFCRLGIFKDSFAPFLRNLDEVNHLFTIADFFEEVTSEAFSGINFSKLLDLRESVNLHFSANGLVTDVSFSSASGRDFYFVGASMVRRGGSLHVYVIGGEMLPDHEWGTLSEANTSEWEVDFLPTKEKFLRESIERNGSARGRPLSLEGVDKAHRKIISMEISLSSGKILRRAVLSDFEFSYTFDSDDPDQFNHVSDRAKRDKYRALIAARLSEAEVLFNMAEFFAHLPVYFAKRIEIQREIVAASGLSHLAAKPKAAKGVQHTYKYIDSLAVTTRADRNEFSLIPPHLEVDTSGHWRRLSPGSIGRDPDGRPESNRTWVKKENPWRSRPERSAILVKLKLADAKEAHAKIVTAAEAAFNSVPVQDADPQAGLPELYIMHCSSMDGEIYKVGWTTKSAQERASELTSQTAAPMAFNVIKTWQHEKADALEAACHAMLLPYRVNNRREFFRAPLEDIIKVIEMEVDRLNRR